MRPRVSVVIPTHARETRLAFALEALAEQTLPAGEFEVVVVRSAGASGPFAEPPDGLRVRHEWSPENEPVPKRNAGWRAARAPLIAFADDDCRAAPDWLAALLDVAETDPDADVIVQGRTEPDPDERHLLFGLARTIEITEPSGLYETCNLLYPRSLLERLGGFADEFRLHSPWGEDTDLGLRAEGAGARLAYADDALVWHAVHPNPLPRALREAGRRRRFARLVARHPRLREKMPAGIFVNWAHAGIACASAGALLAAVTPRRRRAVAALGAMPYLARMVVEFVSGETPVTARSVARMALHIPARAAVDAAETAATVRGAVEDRSLVI